VTGSTGVRPATTDDLPWAQDVLGRAFEDDPVWEWVVPPDRSRRHSRLATIMGLFVEAHLPHGEVFVTDDRSAMGVWCPPKTWRVPGSFYLRKSPRIVHALGLSRVRSLMALGAIEKAPPREPHHYLAMLGTDPLHQGKGHGGSLVSTVTTRADAEGVGCYLESSKESNLAFYNRFGFEVTGEFHIPDGPTMWFMWRDPRS